MARLGNHNRKSRAAFAAAAVFLAVAAILFGVLLHFYRDASPSPSPNGTPQETATESAGGRESEFPTVDWDYWKSVNGDVIGWITVPGTDINHPILQAHASDPDYYLHHDIYRNYNPLGALYLDAECEKEGFQSPNAVILGHSLRIGGAITCFGNIQNYSDKTFASEHAKVLIQTPEKKMRYTVRFANIVKGWEPTKRTAFAVSEDTSRPMLKCVNLIFGADGLQAVSTDSFRIASAKGDRESRGNISFLIPAASLEKLAGLVSDREKLQVGTTGKAIVFRKENFLFAARIMEGPYLAVSQVLSNLKQQFTVLTDAALLRDTILQALSVTGTQNRFSLSFAGNRLTVRCESEYGISETAMDVVALSGEPVGVYWYNPAQLMECLKALNGTLMLEVVQHSALLLKTDELVCFQMAVREPKAIETRPQKTKKPRKEAA